MINRGQLQENPMGTQPLRGLILKFAIPGIISSLINSLHNIVDQAFVGWGIGDLGIAATNIAFPITTIITALSALLGMGGAAGFSLFLGKKEPEEAGKRVGNALTLMVLCGIVLAVCAVVFLEPMLYLFGATEVMMPYARPYTLVISLGIPFGLFATGAAYFIRADGNPNFSSIVLLSGAVFNIIFDPFFLFVLDMGIMGVALATVLGQALSTALALYYLCRKFHSVPLCKRCFSPQLKTVGGMFSLGMAPFFTHLAGTVAQIVQMNMLRHYGALSAYGSEVPIAAAGAVGKVMILMLSCVIGISLGCQPIYGYNYGSRQYERVKDAYFLALRYATVIAVAAFLCIQLFPRQILMVFGSDDPLFYDFSVRYIRIYLFMTFANALQPVTSTFFTSIGKAKLGFWMSLIRQGFLLIPLLLILPHFMGIDGVFWSGLLSDAVAALVVVKLAVREVRNLQRLQKEQTAVGKE